jgi:hypothetical protein
MGISCLKQNVMQTVLDVVRFRASLIITSQAFKEISGKLVTQEAAGHAGSDLEKIWDDTFVESTDSFFRAYDPDRIEYRFIFISHTLHPVDLKSSA